MDVTPILDQYAKQSTANPKQVDFVGPMNALSLSPMESEHTLDILAYLSATHELTWKDNHPFSHLASLVATGNYHSGTPLRAALEKEDQAILPLVCKNVMGKNIAIHAAVDKQGKQAFLPVYDENDTHLFYISEAGEPRRLDRAAAEKSGFTLHSESNDTLEAMRASAPEKVKADQVRRVTTFILGEIAPALRLHKGREMLEKTLKTLPQLQRPGPDAPARKI